MRIDATFPLAALSLLLLTSPPARGAAADAGKVFQSYCAQCHGAQGEGNSSLAAPTIAGLPEWYIFNQLNKFRSGVRGAHPKDVAGMRMYAIARYLRTDDESKAMATFVATLPAVANKPTLTGGDATRGQATFALCSTCHGADAAGNQALNAPKIAGQNDWYMLTQLEHFKAGIRAGDPAADPIGSTMRAIAIGLDEQSMRDVIAHIQTLGAKP